LDACKVHEDASTPLSRRLHGRQWLCKRGSLRRLRRTPCRALSWTYDFEIGRLNLTIVSLGPRATRAACSQHGTTTARADAPPRARAWSFPSQESVPVRAAPPREVLRRVRTARHVQYARVRSPDLLSLTPDTGRNTSLRPSSHVWCSAPRSRRHGCSR
jgi:hypothetical protein